MGTSTSSDITNNDMNINNIVDDETLKILKDTSINDDCKGQIPIIEHCPCLKRLASASKLYANTKFRADNDNDRNIFIQIAKQYISLLNDNIHLIQFHADDIELIQSELNKSWQFECTDPTKCESTARRINRRNANKDVDKSRDEQIQFFQHVMDGIHHYIMHIFDDGFCVKHSELNIVCGDDEKKNVEDDEEEMDDDDGINKILVKMRSIINEKRKLFGQDMINNNKFTLNTVIDEDDDEKKDKLGQKKTFESGQRFYYWPQYKNDEKYVAAKYENWKDEILNADVTNSGIIDFDGMHQVSITTTKANEYLTTKHVKKLRSKNINRFKYGIKNDTPFQMDHLCAVILYTDTTALSRIFSATFRPLTSKETDDSIMKRNSYFAHWSRLLREVVELFGGLRGRAGKGVKGPFYTGLNDIFYINSFAINLNAPTSTTKSLSVALSFADGMGMVIQLNNYGSVSSHKVSCFDTKYISAYPEEQEYLFFGGYGELRIEGVTLASEGREYKNMVAALYYFDAMLRGIQLHDSILVQHQAKKKKAVKNKYKKRLSKLINNRLSDKKDDTPYDQYTIGVFDTFCDSKTQIILKYQHIEENLQKISDLIVDEVKANKSFKVDNINSNKNALNTTIFKLFPNLETITIFSSCDEGSTYYDFNILSLIPLMKINSVKIEIISDHRYNFDVDDADDKDYVYMGPSWLSLQVQELIEPFKQIGQTVMIKTVHFNYDFKRDHLVIEPL